MPVGDCYQAAGNAVLDLPFGTRYKFDKESALFVAHGLVTGTGGKVRGVRFGHAWIESVSPGEAAPIFRTTAIDLSNDREISMPAMVYYAIGRIVSAEVTRYTVEEYRALVLEHGHWGSFTLEEYHEAI